MKQHGKQVKKNSEQNTNKNDRFRLDIPADIRQSLNMPLSPSKTTTPAASKTSNTPVTQSSPSKTESPSSTSTSSSPITIRNIRLPTKYLHVNRGTSAQKISARETSAQDLAQSSDNHGNCCIILLILFKIFTFLHLRSFFRL